MILAIIFAQVWGVLQLIALTSLSRTVRVRTVLAAMAVGFYAVGPITSFLELSWIHMVAHVLGKTVFALTGVASYTVDPFSEEAMKLLPLLLLMLVPAIRRQWSVTDCLLIAAATGSGFGLAEHLFRYADYASTAQSVNGGYAMTIGNATPLVPGIAYTLTTWIPLGVFFASNAVHLNWHLAWSAICGLAVGLFLRYPKTSARFTAGLLLVLIGLDHAAGNAASIEHTWLAWFAIPHQLLDKGLALLVLIAIVAAWWLDRSSQRAGMALGPLLATERAAQSGLAGTLTAALSRLPWSIPWVCGFVRARRAYHAARAAAPDTVDDMRDAIIAARDGVDRKLSEQAAPSVMPLAWMPSNVGATLLSALRRPSVIIWLVLITPSMFYLIIGGFPATSGLQTVMKGPSVWPLVLLITLLGQGRRVWRMLVYIRMLPAALRQPIGDDAAMLTLQAASALGTLSLAGFTFERVLSGVGAGDRMLSAAHAADAANRVQPAGGAAIAGSSNAIDPPPPASPRNNVSASAAAAPAPGSPSGGASNAPGSGGSRGGSGSGSSPPNAGPSDYSPLPPPGTPAPPEAPLPLLKLPESSGTPSEYSPLPPPGTPDPPEAPLPLLKLPESSGTPSEYSPLPPPGTPDPPEAPLPLFKLPESSGTPSEYSPLPSPKPDNEEGFGLPRPKPASPSPQAFKDLARFEQADDDEVAARKELGRLEQADDDAVAAQKAAQDAAHANQDGGNRSDSSDSMSSRKKP